MTEKQFNNIYVEIVSYVCQDIESSKKDPSMESYFNGRIDGRILTLTLMADELDDYEVSREVKYELLSMQNSFYAKL